MRSSLNLFTFMHLVSIFLLMFAYSPSSMQPLCHDDESSTLLQFKESFIINKSASGDPSAYSKVATWKLRGGNGDCCSWDGVECDQDTGHVIGLDLTSSCLYGSINSSSTLFRLAHLERLSLADNHFNYSEIPPAVRNLSKLSYLNLSHSFFSGQVPTGILELSKLIFLDLSGNPLKLQKPDLRSLVEKLSNLKELYLTEVNMSSTVPHVLPNLSSLIALDLQDCGLHGEFPTGIFLLPNLRFLSVQSNPHLTGHLPEFHRSSPLETLLLGDTNFSGELPDSIGNLKSLNTLDITDCNFSGSIPSSLGDLNKLTYLDLTNNSFSGQIPSSFANLTQLTLLGLFLNPFSRGTLSWLGKQTKLTHLGLSDTNSYGDIPSSLGNLTQLTDLLVDYNRLTGKIPFWIGNLTQLLRLQLAGNQLHGPVPQSISRLVNLEFLRIDSNHLSGTLKFDLFLKLKNLFGVELSYNNLTLLANASINGTLPKLGMLGLSSCNLEDFPNFLRGQNELLFLSLSNNKIKGQIPEWMLNMGNLTDLELHSNYLTGFESLDRSPVFLPWTNLVMLDLSDNKLQGSLPIPPLSIFAYTVSNNSLTGEIPSMICNLTSLFSLDLSYNNFSGFLPSCLSTVSDLVLRNNHFNGTIPQTYMKECKLRMIDFRQNQLQGQLPRSLANCTMLEMLDLGNNQINDTFPSWLGILPQLKVLIFGSNRFHGAIGKPKTNFEFPKLQIIDLSNNSFRGTLPSEYFQTWTAMKSFDANRLDYMHAYASLETPGQWFSVRDLYSVTLTNKGTTREIESIPIFLAAIDLSANRFDGEIPQVIGNLKALYLLNLANNFLSGRIPSSLGNLTELESLDLSQNQLSGEIPQELLQLTFLEFLNVSQNRLTGSIPHGKQFDTFEDNSFVGNPGLCGNPLSKMCETSPPPPSSLKENQGPESKFEFDWKIGLMGYGSGLVIGIVIGHSFTRRKHEWFVKTVEKWQLKRREKKRGHRN